MNSEAADKACKQFAQQYADVYGRVLLREHADMQRQNVRYITPRADANIAPLIGKRKRKGTAIKIIAAVAAVIILIIALPAVLNRGQYILDGAYEDTAEPEAEYGVAAKDGELMPLNFVLPSKYTVADSKLDNGKSVYYLDNSNNDDVVLIMEKPEAAVDYYNELYPVYIDDYTAYGLDAADYKILVFEHGGILYTLTCQYDLATLVGLYRSIVY